MPFPLREDVAKLKRLDRETLFLVRKGITAMEQLTSSKEWTGSGIEFLTAQRNGLRKELWWFTPKGNQLAAEKIRDRMGQLSQWIKKLRKKVTLCDGIVLRPGRVKENPEQPLTQQNTEYKKRRLSYTKERCCSMVKWTRRGRFQKKRTVWP